MSFSGLFAIGLSGVNAYSTSLEAVSQNIANTQTTGYKRERVDFSNLLTSLTADGGGIDGGGVDATTRTQIAQQGAITRSATSTNLAISGDGFFVVSDASGSSGPVAFTRAGGFSALENGDLVNAAGYFLRGAPVDDNGNAAIGGLASLETVNINRIPGLAQASSAITLAGNLSSSAASGETFIQNVQIFDADGAARNLAITFTGAGPGVYDVSASFTDGALETVASGTLAFGAGGRVDATASTFPLTFSANAGQSIDLNTGGLILGPGATQFTTAAADGAAFGALTGVSISQNGRVTAEFANGLTHDIYQLAVANFVNAEALEKGEGSTFLQTSEAGNVLLDIPQSGRAGAIEGGALELSTVDIAQEFSTLIETQRAYAANTRVISIADELWQTLTQTAS